MERNREARRRTMVAAANGGFAGGLSKRRQRSSSSFRDSPEEDGRMEMPETSRLRDRAAKKDREGERSSRSKRRRGERMLHGSNRDEDDESSEESMDEDEEDEEDDLSVPVRLPPPSSPPPNPAAASSSPQQNHQHNHHHHPQQTLRKSFPPKVVKWKADETIGVTVPRKARSASTKRSHESQGLGGGEQISRQASMSPSRLSPALTAQISPSSSIGSLRKKMKQITGAKHRPPKISKSTSLDEIEVAEVLFGMTRQFECLPKQDSHKLDARDVDGASGNEAKSRVSSPSSMSLSPAVYPPALPSSNSCSNPSSLPTVAPKRKKPRPVKFDEESPTSPAGLNNLSSLSLPSAGKIDSENQIKTEASSPRSEKNNASPAINDGGGSVDILVSQAGLSDVEQHELVKTQKNKVQDLHQSTAGGSDSSYRVEDKEVIISTAKEAAFSDLDVNLMDTSVIKMAPDSPKGEKFKIDLMAPPPGKLSPERDDLNDFDSDHKAQGPAIEMALKANNEKKEEKVESTSIMDRQQVEKSVQKDFDLKKQVVFKPNLDLQLDLDKLKKDDIVSDKVQTNKLKAKDPKVEPKQEKSATSLHGPMAVGTWPGSFPPYGYTGQIPSLQAVVPMDGTSGHSNSLQSPALFHMHPRSKRCATHSYIAQMISNHQELARMSSFWTAATSAAPFFGPKPYNLNIVPPSEAGKPMKGSFLGMNMGSLQDSKGTPGAPVLTAAYTGLTSQEKMPAASSTILEATNQRKQLVLQQIPQSGSTTNMPNGPAFIFPINLQQTAAAANAANRAGAEKSTTGVSADVRPSVDSSSAAGSSATGGSVTPMNVSFASLPPNEAQYLAFLQNSAYPFPVPPHIAGSPPFRGTNYAQAVPFFYPSHMLHPTQLRPQQQQAGPLLPHAQQSHQNPSTSSGSSSQKHPQQSQYVGGSSSGGAGTSSHGVPATKQRQELLPQHARQQECNKGMENNLRNANAAITIGDHGDRQPVYQQAHQKQNMKLELTSPQAFAIPYAPFGGVAAAPPGLDFSSMAQNPAIFQSFPEAYRHGYHQMATAAAAASAQAAEQKVHQVAEDGKPVARESVNANITGEDDRKTMAASKGPGNGPQHSFVSRTDNEPPIIGNSVVDISSRSLNLVQAPSNGGKSTNRSSSTAIATTSVLTTTTNVSYSQQQQQILIQLQKQQQQKQHQLASSRLKTSASSNNANILPENLPGGSAISKFPQALIQGSNPTQWPQSKTSAGRAAGHAAATPIPAVKNNFLQLQGREAQHPLPAQNHQTQISFGMNSSKLVPSGGQHLTGAWANPPPSSTTIAVGSPSNSASKSAGGSPRASASVKPGPQTSAAPIPQQATIKQSPSSSCSKSLPMSNTSMPSILGHPQRVPAPSSNPKQQQQSQLLQKQQPFSQAQLFLPNPHMQQVQCAQSSASAPNAAQYYQKVQSEQQTQRQPQQQQQRSALSSTGMLSLCAPSTLTLAGAPTTSDPAKAMATANGMKSLPPSSFLSAAQLAVAAQSASGSHPPNSATFAYMPLPSISMKPLPEQKPAAGSDNVHARQPDKI